MNFINIEKCPIECVCEDNMRLIDCSNRGLQQIPPAIPLRAIKIDLSSNQLTQLNVSVLQNHQELRALILFNNKIEKINENKVRESSCPLKKHTQCKNVAYYFVFFSDSSLKNFIT